MNSLIVKFMEISLTLIALGLILKNQAGFNGAVSSVSTGTTGIIGQLQQG